MPINDKITLQVTYQAGEMNARIDGKRINPSSKIEFSIPAKEMDEKTIRHLEQFLDGVNVSKRNRYALRDIIRENVENAIVSEFMANARID